MVAVISDVRDVAVADVFGVSLGTLAVNGFVQYLPEVSAVALLILSFVVIASGLAISRYVLATLVDSFPPGVRVIAVLAVLFLVGLGAGLAVLSLGDNAAAAFGLSINAGIASTLLGALFGMNHAAAKEMEALAADLLDYFDYELEDDRATA